MKLIIILFTLCISIFSQEINGGFGYKLNDTLLSSQVTTTDYGDGMSKKFYTNGETSITLPKRLLDFKYGTLFVSPKSHIICKIEMKYILDNNLTKINSVANTMVIALTNKYGQYTSYSESFGEWDWVQGNRSINVNIETAFVEDQVKVTYTDSNLMSLYHRECLEVASEKHQEFMNTLEKETNEKLNQSGELDL